MNKMKILVADLEGVFLPEIWINVAIKTGIEELDALTDEAVKITGCSPEEGYPGFDVASYLVDTFGGSIERVESSPV